MPVTEPLTMLFVRDFLDDQTIRRHPAGPTAPIVSVILPTYRRCAGGYLERAINSVLSQTFSDFELLVMDDGSTDGSAELIETFCARDPRVVHVRHERNSGLPALRVNEGIELARGRYLAFQFDDDVWRPQALQALVETMQKQTTPAIIVGQACFTGRSGQWVLPSVELSLVTLYEQNRLANNCALIPRHLMVQYGMYDCHIGMRRLCDWDLWLRYIKHIPFILVEEIISDVYESNPGSIGLTVPWDLALFRHIHDIPRDSLLTPEKWRDYEVDALAIGGVVLSHQIKQRLYEDHLVPYYCRFRHHFPQLEGFQATRTSKLKYVLYTKGTYDVSNDVTLNHYDPVSNRRGHYKATFQPLAQVECASLADVDALLLVRTVEDHARDVMTSAMRAGKPTGIYLDDDLLTFHEFGSAYDYLAPGTPYHRNISNIIEQADAVWVTNRFLAGSVRHLSTRIVPHNNCVPMAKVPNDVSPRAHTGTIKIGYVGSGYRIDEFRVIWEALERISREYRERLTFEFWGLDTRSMPELTTPIIHRQFTFSYQHYLTQLSKANFDILLAPLLDYPRPRLAKSLIKYLETAVAGAFGIFSDVPQYSAIPGDVTCLKAANTPEAWYEALKKAITMPDHDFDQMRRRLLHHVREVYTETAQIHLHEAAWHATEFHALTRTYRHQDGSPRIMYVLHSANFGGGEIQLWRRLNLMRQYGIVPIVVLPKVLAGTETVQRLRQQLESEGLLLEFVDYTCFTEPRSPQDFYSEHERNQIRTLLERYHVALVHTVTFIPTFGQVCAELGIPHVASLYAVDDGFTWPQGRPDFRHADLVQSDSIRYARRWGELLGVEHFCSREMVPEEVFNFGTLRHLEQVGQSPPPWQGPVKMLISGTIQPRKRQAEIIEAVGRLVQEGWDCRLDLYGYTHFFPDYLEQCQQNIRKYGLEERVTFRGFSENMLDALAATDIVLSLSTYESFPSSIKEAMAAGVLVVATPVGGIPELIIDEVSGILCTDTSVDALVAGIRRALQLTPEVRQRIVQQARRVARSEFHPQRVANDLLTMYVMALSKTRQTACQAATPATQRSLTDVLPSPPRVSIPTVPPQGYVRVGSGVRYRLQTQHPYWCGVEVLILTQQRPVSGALRLRIYGAHGQLLRETAANLAQARDQEWLPLSFEPIVNSTRGQFELEFTVVDPGPGQVVGLFENNPLEPFYRRGLRRLGIPLAGNTLYCKLWYSPPPSR